MPLELPTLLKPFDMTDRPGGARGAAPTALSAMDLSGIIYRQVAKKDGVPAVSTPVTDLPGVAGIVPTASPSIPPRPATTLCTPRRRSS